MEKLNIPTNDVDDMGINIDDIVKSLESPDSE